jgi:two-component system, cell cycle sensor histidine kinase and response regulator CckA
MAGILEPAVAAYGFRLNRIFGPNRVGWCLVAAFSSLTLVHLLAPPRPIGGVPALAELLILFLLLLGMVHIEIFFSRTSESARQREWLEQELAARDIEKQHTALTNQQLLEALAAEQANQRLLKESEQQFRSLFTENPMPMWIFDLRSFRFLAVNDAALGLLDFSREQFMALSARDIRPAEDVGAFVQDSARPCQAGGARQAWRYYTRDRRLVSCETVCKDLVFNGSPSRLVLAEDVTHCREMERQCHECARTEAAMQLAGGIAHHFNNALTPVLAHADLLLHQNLNNQIADQVKQISTATARAAGLASHLLAFGRRRRPEKKLLDLNHAIEESSRMLQRMLGDSISLKTEYCPQMPKVRADPGMLAEILIKLALNAREAMPAGGQAILRTALAQSETTAKESVEEFVYFALADRGCGMTPQVQARLFEPFFSTREKGTGLGLATVQAIVQQHGGWIEVDSQPGAGSEFRIYLPAARL